MDRWAQRGVTVGELRDGTAARRRPWVTAYFRRAGAQHLVRPVQAQAAVPAPASGRRWLGRRRRDAATAPSLTTTTPLLRSVTVPAGTWRAVPAPLGHGRQQIPAAASMKMTGVTGALHRTVPSAGANLPRPRQTRRVRRTASALAHPAHRPAAVLLVAFAAACYRPIRTATRVDPAESLRAD